MLPENIKNILNRYVKDKVPTGGFLRAVLANDLMETFGKVDEYNQAAMLDILSYVYNYMPDSCHGSYDIVDKWLKGE